MWLMQAGIEYRLKKTTLRKRLTQQIYKIKSRGIYNLKTNDFLSKIYKIIKARRWLNLKSSHCLKLSKIAMSLASARAQEAGLSRKPSTWQRTSTSLRRMARGNLCSNTRQSARSTTGKSTKSGVGFSTSATTPPNTTWMRQTQFRWCRETPTSTTLSSRPELDSRSPRDREWIYLLKREAQKCPLTSMCNILGLP